MVDEEMKEEPLKIAIIALLAAIAFGVNWMAYEQHRANAGVFVPFPTPQSYHVQ